MAAAVASSSSKPCAEMDNRVLLLPPDIVCEIMLRLPSKELCRVRAVCRPCRAFLSSPLFIAGHAARHPVPRLIARYADNREQRQRDTVLSVTDLSGQVVSQVRRRPGEEFMSVASDCDLILIRAADNDACRLVSASIGAVYLVPDGLAEEHVAQGLKLSHLDGPVHMFGFVAKKGLYKVLRLLAPTRAEETQTLFEVCTLNNGCCDARWRAKRAPTLPVSWHECAVIDGVLYLLSEDAYIDLLNNRQVMAQDWIVPFDLDAEEWMPNIRGPKDLIDGSTAASVLFQGHHSLGLRNANGSLVIVHDLGSYTDIWFLTDSEQGLWVKRCSVRPDPRLHRPLDVRPLLVLDDGRIVIFRRTTQALHIHDPRNNTLADEIRLRHRYGVTMYTVSQLSKLAG